jgi:hypothetical protein
MLGLYGERRPVQFDAGPRGLTGGGFMFWLLHPYLWWVIRRINKSSKWTATEVDDMRFFEDLTTKTKRDAQPFIYHSMYRKETDGPVDRSRHAPHAESLRGRRDRSV